MSKPDEGTVECRCCDGSGLAYVTWTRPEALREGRPELEGQRWQVRCPNCHGTGRLQPIPVTWPEGGVVMSEEGSYPAERCPHAESRCSFTMTRILCRDCGSDWQIADLLALEAENRTLAAKAGRIAEACVMQALDGAWGCVLCRAFARTRETVKHRDDCPAALTAGNASEGTEETK